MDYIAAFFIGICIGLGQLLTQSIFIAGIRNSTLTIILIIFIYLFSALFWINLIKDTTNLNLLYAIFIFGSLISIYIISNFTNKNHNLFDLKQISGIILMASGCYLLK